MTVVFESFDTETSADVLNVRDGSSATSTLLIGLSGDTTTVGYSQTATADIFLEFLSDGNPTVDSGFKIIYSSAWSLKWS